MSDRRCDCTRLRVLRLYPNKSLNSSLAFLQEVIKAFLFPIQRIQTDWGTEFFNYEFQEVLAENFIKFRPIKPRSPHLNGKAERSQQIDKEERSAAAVLCLTGQKEPTARLAAGPDPMGEILQPGTATLLTPWQNALGEIPGGERHSTNTRADSTPISAKEGNHPCPK